MHDEALPARVAVCVCTYRRPDGLARLLEGLDRQQLPDPAATLEIVVVDNDADASARETCERAGASGRWPVRYAVEPDPGIAQARNRAVALALPGADVIAFVDDDELPGMRWVHELLLTARETGADIVMGPVRPLFETPPPSWIARGRFFERLDYPDAAPVRYGAAGNVLVRSRVFERLDGWFDPRLGTVGGEDSLFFRRARLAGCLIVWAGRAEITEWIPPHRAMAGWLLRRSFRGGNAATLGRILTDDRLATRVSSALVSTARLLLALVRLPLAPWRGHHVTVRRLRAICYRLGSLAAVCGYQYEEYRRSEGSRLRRRR